MRGQIEDLTVAPGPFSSYAPRVGYPKSFVNPRTLALSSVLCLVTSTGYAQTPEPSTQDTQDASASESGPSSADRATARTLAQEGYVALNAKDYSTAADRFTRALALVHAPTLLRDLARAQVGLGKLVDAQETYNTIIREGVAHDAPAPWVKALADAKVELAAIPPRLPWVTITVTGPAQPRVTIDGKPISSASIGVKRPLDPGRHEIRALATGYYTAKRNVTLNEGESLDIAFELEEAPPDAPVKTDDETKGEVVVTFADPAWRKPAMVTSFAVGGAGLVLGAVTGIMALSKHSSLSTDCALGVCGPDHKADLDTYHTLGTLATVGFVVAGVGAAAGTVLLFVRPQPIDEDEGPKVDTARVTWSPFVGLGSAGVEGTF